MFRYKNLFIGFFLIIAFFFVVVRPVWAGNKFGIHILETAEVFQAAKIVNSNGGDWGYVTIVLRDDDFDTQKWQDFFDQCRRLHIIPIVRIATHMNGQGEWVNPDKNDLDKWVDFLNKLNWPVLKQLVVVFNEPNHAKEWGGQVNPQQYGEILGLMINKFESVNPDFVVLNAGLDQAAPNSTSTMDEALFLQKMFIANPGLAEKIKGFCSHSYPNHGFIGSPDDIGKGSIIGYKWELEYLKNYGLSDSVKVYITETGWPHKQGLIDDNRFFDQAQTAENINKAYDMWLSDDQVEAVTPFVLNYPADPFDHFSWIDHQGNSYLQTEKVLGLAKKAGSPEQKQEYLLDTIVFPQLVPTNYDLKFKLGLKNIGQSIIGERNDFSVPIQAQSDDIMTSSNLIDRASAVEPSQVRDLDLSIKTGTMSGEKSIIVNGKKYSFVVFKPWSLQNPQLSKTQQFLASVRWFFKSIFDRWSS